MITKLKNETIQKIKSEYIIKDIPQIIEKLLSNSINAKSKNIIINLELEQYNLEIHDDGNGINESVFNFIGEDICK
jgi:DNA mismatch repair ATPase MutL